MQVELPVGRESPLHGRALMPDERDKIQALHERVHVRVRKAILESRERRGVVKARVTLAEHQLGI